MDRVAGDQGGLSLLEADAVVLPPAHGLEFVERGLAVYRHLLLDLQGYLLSYEAYRYRVSCL